MIIDGSCKCEHCGCVFKWYHKAKQSLSSSKPLYDVNEIPDGVVALYRIGGFTVRDEYKIPTIAEAFCPKCNKLTMIDNRN